MLHPGKVKAGDFVRPLATSAFKNKEVAKVVIVSGNGDLVVELPNGDFAVCKANELRISGDEAA
jgi:hypothetical protein